jgi:hypothetical protein
MPLLDESADLEPEVTVRTADSVDISFTDLLYAIVAGSVFQHLDPYKWSWDNVIIVASVLVFVDDWVLYHAQASRIVGSLRNYTFLLVSDIALLLLWYTAARAGSLGSVGLLWFVSVLGCFYLGAGLSEFLFDDRGARAALITSDLMCCAILWAWAGILYVTAWHSTYWIAAAVVVTLIPLRVHAWKRLLPFQARTLTKSARIRK